MGEEVKEEVGRFFEKESALLRRQSACADFLGKTWFLGEVS